MAGPSGGAAPGESRSDRPRVRARRRRASNSPRRMSGITLALDGATYSATVALLRDGKLVSGERVDAQSMEESGGRGEALMPLISKMLAADGARPREIRSIICGGGPGSFTS